MSKRVCFGVCPSRYGECPKYIVRRNVQGRRSGGMSKKIGEGPGKVQGDRRMTRVYVLDIMSKGVYRRNIIGDRSYVQANISKRVCPGEFQRR